jgi:hypothetical protein
MKKCPPGVICIENVTVFLLFIIIGILVFFIYINTQTNSKKEKIIVEQTNNTEQPLTTRSFTGLIPSWPYSNVLGPKDVLLDPYAAPYRDERYVVPINISTNIGAVPPNTAYRQMGILKPLNGVSKDNILPLMGRPLFTNRDKWQYYSISNQHNNVKLPILFKGRRALNDYGVDQIFSGDTVYVEGYNEPFRATLYENDTIQYLPFI